MPRSKTQPRPEHDGADPAGPDMRLTDWLPTAQAIQITTAQRRYGALLWCGIAMPHPSSTAAPARPCP